MNTTYLDWLLGNTSATWWHDSGDPQELATGLELKASGVTTNPVLCATALAQNTAAVGIQYPRGSNTGAARAGCGRSINELVVKNAAERLLPQYTGDDPCSGYVCAQVNPGLAGDREPMLAMARRFHSWAPNIAVKLPATAAGLDVLEECVAEGITITSTVSFTVAQVLAAAERHRRGSERARKNGVIPGRCFAVIMIGRIDDYLRDVAHDSRVAITEEGTRLAGLAVAKRAYGLLKKSHSETRLLIAALRGPYHLAELAGADMIVSIHPKVMGPFLSEDLPRELRIDRPIDKRCGRPSGAVA